jgi:hypothetical protein
MLSDLCCGFSLCSQIRRCRSIARHLCSHRRGVWYDELLWTRCQRGLRCSQEESRLGRLSQHARGPFLRSHRSNLLARRAPSRVGIWQQDSSAVGGGDRDVSQHARGPFRLCHCGGLLARRPGASHEPRRYLFASNTSGCIAFQAAAAVQSHFSAGSVDIPQSETLTVAST